MPRILEPSSAPADARRAEFGLSARSLHLMRSLLATYPQIRQATLYGSRAKGSYREGSDIDIALDAPEMSFGALLQLAGKIDDLMLPWDVDLTLMKHIDNPALLEHIARVGQVLWLNPLTVNH